MSEILQPVIQLGGLTIAILHAQFPDSESYWDRNVVNCRVKAEANGAIVTLHDEFVHMGSLQQFALNLAKVYETLKGECELAPLNANFRAKVTAYELGNLGIEVLISPDWSNQTHEFSFSTDQSYLPATLASIRAALELYPVIGNPHD
jgi:hypothetical protein